MICPQWSAGDSPTKTKLRSRSRPSHGSRGPRLDQTPLHCAAPEGTAKSIDAVKGKLSRSEFIRRAILHEIERVLTAKLKRTRK
jgi:hypothetical protein